MRGLLIYSIFGSALKGETAFSMRRAKNCSTLDVLLKVISEAFLGSSTGRNRWLRSSMAQSKIVTGFFLQQMPHTAEKHGAMKCLSLMFSGLCSPICCFVGSNPHLLPVLSNFHPKLQLYKWDPTKQMTDGLWDFLFSFSRMFKSLTLLSQVNRGTRQLLKDILKPDLLNSRFADPFLM